MVIISKIEKKVRFTRTGGYKDLWTLTIWQGRKVYFYHDQFKTKKEAALYLETWQRQQRRKKV